MSRMLQLRIPSSWRKDDTANDDDDDDDDNDNDNDNSANGKKKCEAIKVVWASQLYGVDLCPVMVDDDDDDNQDDGSASLSWGGDFASLSSLSSSSSSMTSSSGNFMSQAIRWIASSRCLPPAKRKTTMMTTMTTTTMDPYSTLTEDAMVDEWCEWERIHSHPVDDDDDDDDAIMNKLEQFLSSSSSSSSSSSRHYLVGNCTTLADIVVVTTLLELQKKQQKQQTKSTQETKTTTTTTKIPPPAVRSYLDAHTNGYRSARTSLEEMTQRAAAEAASSKSSKSSKSKSSIIIDRKNPSVQGLVRDVFASAIGDVFRRFDANVREGLLPSKNWVARCANPKQGDYQISVAMPLFASYKKFVSSSPSSRAAGDDDDGNDAASAASVMSFKSPQDVAKAIIASLTSSSSASIVTDLSMNGPGFILCRLHPTFLQERLMDYFRDDCKLPKPRAGNNNNNNNESDVGGGNDDKDDEKTICLVDFSSPNIAKEMHVGHLRSTIIGESVCRILEWTDHAVHRINHVGDWGTQFGMLIQYLREEYPDFANSTPNISDLTSFYKSAKSRFDDSAAFKEQSRLNVVSLQSGDAECLAVWKILCDISRSEFEKVYKRLDINLTECGESFYNDRIPPVIDEFENAGLITIEEGGAKCVFLPGYKVPLMLQKSDGGYGYDSTDMAALKHRIQTLRASRIIVITDFSQADHFAMCYEAARKIGWAHPSSSSSTSTSSSTSSSIRLEHIGFGTVQGEDGKRFKTRSGDTVRLVDLLDEAVSRMRSSLEERLRDGRANLKSSLEVQDVAETIGYSAVKYFDLRRNPTTNYKFSYDQMLDTKGNTAVYLLYAHARLESILSKAREEKGTYGVDLDEILRDLTSTSTSTTRDVVPVSLEHIAERNLISQLLSFHDVMTVTLDDLYPYHICDYLYQLAIAASDFVTQCKVLASSSSPDALPSSSSSSSSDDVVAVVRSRLLLCHATTTAMRQCFHLLGMRHVMRI